ncbi:MAG TPA: hypothetical protein VD978_08375 [Azospirillum sp.]|nr:hypothetical protein [Azospirillum sp.]
MVIVLQLDPGLSDRIAAIAHQEGMSVRDLCRLVEERLGHSDRCGLRGGHREIETVAALRRLADSYERQSTA